MFNPIATYRFQFHEKFTFDDFERVISYLQKLGVSTVYASPVFEATPGSTHGYDGVNPHLINPEVGTEEQLRAVSNRLKEDGINWLQDIVPNHMGFHPHNPWLNDVLEKGRLSKYASFFDAAWTSQLFNDDKLMVPFLGNPLEEVIKNGELKIELQDQRLVFKYYDNSWPLHPHAYVNILQGTDGNEPDAIKQLADQFSDLRQVEEPETYALRWEEWLKQLASLYKSDVTQQCIHNSIDAVNNNPEKIRQIADEQVYRLCSWQETDKAINFRRFFTVNSLICLNIQDKAVFDHYHQLIKTLVDDKVFQGLRIDHIDGLYDPAQYLDRLREMAGDETYIVAEKILEEGEDMPHQWPIQGNTGYDFLATVNKLLTNPSAKKKFTHFYEELVNDKQPVPEQIRKKKAHILYEHMNGELDNLYKLLVKLKLADKKTIASIPPDDLKQAIGEVLIHCPVYRYYGNLLPLGPTEAANLKDIFKEVKKEKPALEDALELLSDIILKYPQKNKRDYNDRALQFYQRLMQFSGPLMAKGVEDTLMYTYQRFIGHNEVGDAPEAFGITAKDFHKQMKRRQKHWPLSINGTSTHDTKRGEDVRARLNVLTDMPELWLKTVQQWQQQNAALKHKSGPDANDEYFIYQTMAGAYPMPGQDEDSFDTRIAEYLTKALREGKVNSNWTEPDEEYEQATLHFAKALLNKETDFWRSFEDFQLQIADQGIINSLVQVLLKFTCPGVPDVYQGCELWDLSLVDPDNRRPVDYALREQFLNDLDEETQPAELLQQLWQDRYNAKIKLWLTHQLFNIRKQDANLFAEGHYIPLKVKGKYQNNIIAFARRHGSAWYVVAAPLHLGEVRQEQDTDLTTLNWKNTRIILPPEAPEQWENQFTKTSGKTSESEIAVKDIFDLLPIALLKLNANDTDRGSGILMHITSLPSSFGMGDIGPEAKEFANFLSRSRQKIWQLLPLNPTGPEQNYSPYSSVCSMAGNTLLISPELLAQDGLLESEGLNKYHILPNDTVDYVQATKIKDTLFEQAYNNFLHNNAGSLHKAFRAFCNQEAYWLDDYALYSTLKQHHEQLPWYKWPKEYKNRKATHLKRFADAHRNEISKVKWLQFVFYKQWHQLKRYCRSLNIKLLGDLPFYVSYDSADVWANPANFKLDDEGNMLGVAGVPPDYFNADGQLWGMPVYQWDKLKINGYKWWVQRLRKNMELFDLLRLDHFRAFSGYWEVPANEETAKNGKWQPGPGSEFFQTIKNELGELPFIAEDLGDIDEPVFKLRDEFNLPGMKVLQFAFGDTMPQALYIPHNYRENFVAYTGTHDNNTTVGWFRENADKAIRKQIAAYTGLTVKENNIHLILGRLAHASIAENVILPIQDVLGLDEKARMNNPSSAENNWLWSLQGKLLTNKVAQLLRQWVTLYNRA